MNELEQGALIVDEHFIGMHGGRRSQYMVVGTDGQQIPTEIPVANQIKGQLLLDYDIGITQASIPILQQKLDGIDSDIESKHSYNRFRQKLVIGVMAVGCIFSTAALTIPNGSGESTFDSGPAYKAFAVANLLAYVGIAIGFSRLGRKQRDKELAPLLEQQAKYQTNIAALGSLASS